MGAMRPYKRPIKVKSSLKGPVTGILSVHCPQTHRQTQTKNRHRKRHIDTRNSHTHTYTHKHTRHKYFTDMLTGQKLSIL